MPVTSADRLAALMDAYGAPGLGSPRLRAAVGGVQLEADLILLRSRLLPALGSAARHQLAVIDQEIAGIRGRPATASRSRAKKPTPPRPASAGQLSISGVRSSGSCAASRPSSASSSSPTVPQFLYRPHIAREPYRPLPRERRPRSGQMMRPEQKLKASLTASRTLVRLWGSGVPDRLSSPTKQHNDTSWYGERVRKVQAAYARGVFDPLQGVGGTDNPRVRMRDRDIFLPVPLDNYVQPGEVAALAKQSSFKH